MSDDHVNHWAVATPSLDPLAAMRREKDIHRSRGDILEREVKRLKGENRRLFLGAIGAFACPLVAWALAGFFDAHERFTSGLFVASGLVAMPVGLMAFAIEKDRLDREKTT